MICPISKRFLGHFFVNSPPPSRLVSPGSRGLSDWQRQTLHPPPQHASKQAPREMARHSGKASEEFGNVVFKIGSAGRPNRKSCRPSCASQKAVIQSTANRPTGSLGASSGSPQRLAPMNAAGSRKEGGSSADAWRRVPLFCPQQVLSPVFNICPPSVQISGNPSGTAGIALHWATCSIGSGCLFVKGQNASLPPARRPQFHRRVVWFQLLCFHA